MKLASFICFEVYFVSKKYWAPCVWVGHVFLFLRLLIMFLASYDSCTEKEDFTSWLRERSNLVCEVWGSVPVRLGRTFF